MAEHVSCNNHIYFNSINSKPVHAQKLGKKCVPMTLHNKLQEQKKKNQNRNEDGYRLYIYIYMHLNINHPETTHLLAEYTFVWKQTLKKSCQNNPLNQEIILLSVHGLKIKILKRLIYNPSCL